ncbi:MAG: hypothetical protein Q9213_001236 [Squamulea squamosa]
MSGPSNGESSIKLSPRHLFSSVVAPYPYTKTFEQARYEPFVVVHTSGSTDAGLPKVVIVNHGTMAATDAFNGCAVGDERRPMVLDVIRNKRCFVSMPSFHIAGIDFMLAKALFYGIIPVLGPPGAPVTAELVDAMHQNNMVELSVVAPAILRNIASSPESLENLRRLNGIVYGGGPLPPSAGDAIASRTRLYNFMGSSEMGNVPTEVVDTEDWEYLKFSPKLGYQMRHYSDNLFELCFERQPHLDLFQGVFATFPDLEEYCTSDLYSKHDTKLDLWKYEGRADDVITLTNGEKVNPVTMENIIGAYPDVKSVLVIGQARFQTALLVEAKEPPTSSTSRAAFIDMMWPTIEAANTQCDSHAKIARDLILFTIKEKPFLRAGKGTVQRRLTVDSYRKEIDNMYEVFEQLISPNQLPKQTADPQPQPKETVVNPKGQEDWLRGLLCKVTGWPSLNSDSDFFKMGMDSLQVIGVVRGINAQASAAAGSIMPVTATTVYSNPSVNRLAQACIASPQFSRSRHPETQLNNTASARQMDELISKYSWSLPITGRRPKAWTPNDGMRVLLTGSTGSIGSYVLSRLSENPRVSHIYLFNRSADSEKRQRSAHCARGLKTDWPASRVSFLHGDLSKEFLGLSIDLYGFLLNDVTHIMHNAWEVNFNLPLKSFETPHLVGLRQLIDFSARSVYGASILFISSISSAMDHSVNHNGPVPERIITDASAAVPMGYAQSKHIAERVLSNASKMAGIPTTVVRVGQVAGPVDASKKGGCWNKQEWLPSLIASSKYLHKIPDSLGPNDAIDWIPVDVLSGVLVELLEAPSTMAPSDALVKGGARPANGIHTIKGQHGWGKGQQKDDFNQSIDGSPTTIMRTNDSEGPYDVPPDRTKSENYPTTDGFHESTNHSLSNGISGSYGGDPSNDTQDPDCGNGSAMVYHAVNPHRSTWQSLLPTIQSYFGDKSLEVVSLQGWVNALRVSAAPTLDVHLNPAIRLLDFYQSLADGSSKVNHVFETTETVERSQQLKSLKAVEPDWMKLWLEQWNF